MRREMQETHDDYVSARIPASLAERLKAEANERDRTVSYLVREALVERYSKPEELAA